MGYIYFTFLMIIATITPMAIGAQEVASSPQNSKRPPAMAQKELEASQVYSYYILRNNMQIGTYRFKVTPENTPPRMNGKSKANNASSQGARLRVETDMDVKVKMLFFTAYEAQYEAASIYHGADLLRHESLGKINGKEYIVNYNRSKNKNHLVVNAQGVKLSDPPVTLHPFYRKTQKGDGKSGRPLNFISEKGKIHEVYYQTKGKERIEINAKKFKATHARIVGDITRNLWYDEDGTLLKVAYQKDGATITLVRKDI